MLKRIYSLKPVKRTIIVWIIFFAIQWGVFLLGYMTHKDAWTNVNVLVPDTGLKAGILIFINNFILTLLIAGGNIFARFGSISIGGVILIVQGILIGWTAGTNGFQYPFESLSAANLNYLKIGLWELSAYAIICGVTITKSLYISETFPPKSWIVERKLKDIKFDQTEKALLVLGYALLIIAALIEGYFI